MPAATTRSTFLYRDMPGAVTRSAGRARIERVLDRPAGWSSGSAAAASRLEDSRGI
ncbi:hypothetical protein VQ042_05825 [Aurantimonas sp. A2-1-M11]|uniref:hypothetical protein n=1 Tax=Aurantimonas sp. A2-1-M11 TaxID=3113712 RepID=UPI002F94B80F